MKKLFKGLLSLGIVAAVGIPQINAATNDYRIEVKNYNHSKHTRDGLYGITYTEKNTTYTDKNWPLAEMSHAYTQSNYSYTLATAQMVRQFGVSMGVVYWINPAENYIYWWNTVTGESGRTTPTKSYGVGFADGIYNPNFDFEFLGAETGSGAIAQDWYGNLVHMWNDGLNGWGNTSGTHFVRGYAVYKSATEYGKLMDFTPKLSTMNDTGRKSYPFYRRLINTSDGKLTGSSTSDLSNYEYFDSTSCTPNPNYPARQIDWANKYYHKANTSITKEPTDFLGVSGNLWGKGVLQGSTTLAPSSYYNGYSTGQIFHACDTIVYGNMFADGQYTNWYLNYTLTVGNRTAPGYYPWSGLWKNTYRSNYWHPRDYSFETAPTEYLFMESDVLEYFWSVPYAGLAEYSGSRDGNNWHGYVDDLNYSSYIGTTSTNRHKSDQMSSPEVDSIKGTRVIIHNYWLQWMPFDISDTDHDANKRNGSIIIQYSKYADANGNNPLSTTSAPVFTGSPTRKYTPVGYAYGWAETDAATNIATPTPNFPVKFQNTTVSCWNELERVNNNVFALYTHVPGRGFAKYFITAVKPNNAVSGLKVSQKMDANSNIVNTLTWAPQTYDRETMHTYEVWYRKKQSGATSYEDKETINGTAYETWQFAGKANVNYTTVTEGDTIYTSSYNGCTFEHIAPYGVDANNNNYARVYEYIVIPVYDASSHRGTESAVVTMTSKAPVSPVKGTFKQVTDVNSNGATLYGFSVQLDPKLTQPTAAGVNTAAKMIIVPQDDETRAALANNTGVTVSGGTATETTTTETISSYPSNVTVSGYHVNVTGFSLGSQGELPTVVWHNVNPEKTYNVKVYVESSTPASYYFTPSEQLVTTLIVPELTWSTTPADFHKLIGDYGTLTGNEDMPIGSFRRIDPETNALDETPSNPVTINNANYYGTHGSVLKPVFVTNEVLGTLNASGEYEDACWKVAYGIYLYDENGSSFQQVQLYDQLYSTDFAACYSNVADVICDAIGLKVDFTEVEGEDGRTRKIYNPTQKTYKAKVEVTYRRISDDGVNTDMEIKKTTYTDLVIGSTTLPELGVETAAQSTVKGALYQRSGSHFYYNNAESEGYYPYYYDAAMLFEWDEYTTLNRYMGYYGESTAMCYGHYETDNDGNRNPDEWVQYHAGSILTDGEVASLANENGITALNGGAIGYNSTTDNWSALAITNSQVPMNIHYVHGSNTALNGADAIAAVKFNVTLTAEYPIVNYTVRNAGFMIAEDPATYDIPLSVGAMDVMTVPTELTDMYMSQSSITTGVGGILTNACGGVQLYPNPVESAFTLRAPMALGEVKIFAADGQLVKVVKEISGTMVSINVEDLPQGVYIVNTLGVAQIMIKK